MPVRPVPECGVKHLELFGVPRCPSHNIILLTPRIMACVNRGAAGKLKRGKSRPECGVKIRGKAEAGKASSLQNSVHCKEIFNAAGIWNAMAYCPKLSGESIRRLAACYKAKLLSCFLVGNLECLNG